MTVVGQVDSAAALAAVKGAAARLSELVRGAANPDRKAVGEWDVADVAIHASHVFNILTSVARGAGSVLDDVWNLASMTQILVTGESDRDLKAVADRIDANAAEFLSVMDQIDSAETRPWLVEGIEVPISTVACHALNEILVHGYDISKAEDRPWPLIRAETALVVTGFLFPVVAGLGKAMVAQEKAATKPRSLDIRVRGGGAAVFRFAHGALAVEPSQPGMARVDVHLSVDPTAFLLIAWGRRSQWQEIPRGRLLAWGRKPWVGLQLRGMMRNP